MHTAYYRTQVVGIEALRRIARWADQQDEHLWIPAQGPPASIIDIVRLWSMCQTAGVESPSALPDELLEDWKALRGGIK